MTTSDGSHHLPVSTDLMDGSCSRCGHLVLAHTRPPDPHCTVCVLIEDMAQALLTLAKCDICLALVSPPDKADHERHHTTNTNRPMAEQRERWERDDEIVIGPGAGTHS